MVSFLLFCSFVSFILLVLVAAMRPAHHQLSLFELERRVSGGDKVAKKALIREKALKDIRSLQVIIVSLLLISTVLLVVQAFGWLVGIAVALLISLIYSPLAKLKLIRRLADKIYLKIDQKLVLLVRKLPLVFKIINNVLPSDLETIQAINSREELQYLVAQSGSVLSLDEKNLITNSLSFPEKTVESIMIPRSMIDYIRQKEFLGPLTLDDLHKKGHSRLPVIASDIDHIVGILNIKNLLALDIKKSTTAEKAMDKKVYYIRQDHNLQHALTAFLRTKQHLFIVVNQFRETVGLITLEDIIEALLGRKITDEFEAYDDLRAVALRNPKANNQPEKSENV